MMYLLSHRLLCGSSTFDSKFVAMRVAMGLIQDLHWIECVLPVGDETNVLVVTMSVITSDLPTSFTFEITLMSVCGAVAA